MTNESGGDYPPPGGQPWGGSEGLPPGYQAYPQHPPTVPKGKSPWPWIIGITAVVLAVVAVAAVIVVVTSRSDGDAQAEQTTVVTYELTGTAGFVELSYRGPEHQERPETVSLPWRREVTLHGEDAYFHVEAQTADGSDQELACRVTANGQTIVEDRTVTGLVGCVGRLNEH